METKIESGNLIISIPLEEPTPSKTGKTLIVASTRGNQPTTATIDGRPVIVSLNAYVYPTPKPARPAAAEIVPASLA